MPRYHVTLESGRDFIMNSIYSAFNADDALAGAVDQMQAADFEGDQALKMELESRTRNELQKKTCS